MPIFLGGSGSGSSGTGSEIGYTQITAPVTVTSTTEATGTTIITAAAFTFDGSAVIAEFFAPMFESDSTAAGDSLILSLFEGATQIGRLAYVRTVATATRALCPCLARLRFTPTAASHTYSVTGFSTANNGATVLCGAGGTGVEVPAYIRFTKV